MSFTSKKLVVLESVDSTNNYAMAMIQKGEATSGDAVFAIEQTAGKGRMGKVWESESGANIVMSLTVQMQWLPVQQQFQLSVASALGCFDFFSKYINKNIKIKWPNDILINDRKAGGILIENVIKGNLWQWAVIGIGLNINQEKFETGYFEPISLKKLTGINYDVIALTKELSCFVLQRISKLESGGFKKFLIEYNSNLFCRNSLVKLKKRNIVFETKIIGVSASGELITSDAMERRFSRDEVTWQVQG